MTDRCVTVIAGILEDQIFSHLCYIAESLSTILPNFHYKNISKSSTEWKSWLKEICECYGWYHTKSPLIWREVGFTQTHVHYVGSSHQFWQLLYKYYKIKSHLSAEDLDALQADLLLAHNVKQQKLKDLNVPPKYRRLMIIGAGRSMCLDIVPQLLMMKELWLANGIVINLYDKPGCFFKLRRILRDAGSVGAGLNTINIVEHIPDGLKDCDILLYLDSLPKEEHEETEYWLQRNYEPIESLSKQINEYAPSHMKIIFCSMSLPCYYASIMLELVTKIPSTSIVVASATYGLEIIYSFVNSLGYTLENFGCPPVWGYLDISHYVDIDHMIQKCSVYHPNERALNSSETTILPLGFRYSELRWFFYMSHDKSPYTDHFKRKALARYQVGRSEDFPKCKAICDLLKLWYSKDENIGDEIISLGIASNGSFGIPEGLVFSQPVHLKALEDGTRIWVPFPEFPMPNIPLAMFRNLIDTAIYIKERYIKQKDTIEPQD